MKGKLGNTGPMKYLMTANSFCHRWGKIEPLPSTTVQNCDTKQIVPHGIREMMMEC